MILLDNFFYYTHNTLLQCHLPAETEGEVVTGLILNGIMDMYH